MQKNLNHKQNRGMQRVCPSMLIEKKTCDKVLSFHYHTKPKVKKTIKISYKVIADNLIRKHYFIN